MTGAPERRPGVASARVAAKPTERPLHVANEDAATPRRSVEHRELEY